MSAPVTTRPCLCHAVLRAGGGLAPFEAEPGRSAAVAALRGLAASGEAVVLAFAVLPGEIDLLLGVDSAAELEPLLSGLRAGLSRRTNRALSRRGPLLAEAAAVTVLDADEDWVALAEAIEQRADGDGTDPSRGSSAHPSHAEWVRQIAPGPAPRAPQPAPAGTVIGDLIEVAAVPTVVQLAAVAPLIEALSHPTPTDEALAELRGYVADWYLDDGRTLQVARATLAGLAQRERGAAFLIAGLYGAGKSHLLAALALTCELPVARGELFAAHPELVDLEPAWRRAEPRLVVAVALDEQPPTRSLEDILFQAAEEALARLGVSQPLAETSYVLDVVRGHLVEGHRPALDELAGGSWAALAETEPDRAAAAAAELVRRERLPITFAQSRVERLGRLLELARKAGREGVVFLLDELSVFLAARTRQGLHADASLLQFLGQRAALSPVSVVAALQRQIEDVGDIEHYTLRQIKDRFETRLSLPLAATRQVLARKILRRRDAEHFESAVQEALTAWSGAARLPDLSAARLRLVYPLHPLTAECLEACAERFLARTRSVIEFAAARVGGDGIAPGVLNRPVTALITPDELWSHFARDIVRHGDLRRYHDTVGVWFERHAEAVFGAEAELALRLIRLLLVLRLAGLERDVNSVAAALLPASPDREARVAALLERMRSEGAYVAVRRHEGPGRDVYLVDLEHDVNETIRRRARSLEATLVSGDARLTAVAVDAAGETSFPLATVVHPRSAEVSWRNTRRHVYLALRDLSTLSAAELGNQAGLLADLESAEVLYVFLAEPQRTEAQAEAFTAALAAVAQTRWRGALAAWVPREATVEERRQWTEDAALELLRQDPTLHAGPSGEVLKQRLDEDAEGRRRRLADLVQRLYTDGRVIADDGDRAISGGDWATCLEGVAAHLLERLFPDFGAVAPRRGGLPAGFADDLIAGLIVPGACTIAPGSVRALCIEAAALPLGLATGELGDYVLSRSAGPVAGWLVEALPARPLPVAVVVQMLAHSPYGLTADLAELVLAAMVRAGHLTALDAGGRPARLAAPLRANVTTVAPAETVTEEVWRGLAPLAKAVFGQALPERTRAAQRELCDRLGDWREAAVADVALIREAAREVGEALRHEAIQWRTTEAACRQVAELAEAVRPEAAIGDALPALAAAAAGLSSERLDELFGHLRVLRRFAQSQRGELLRAARALSVVALPAGDELDERREQLVARFGSGEAVAFEADQLLADCHAWRQDYLSAYAAWHASVHDAGRFTDYDALRNGPLMRVLLNLSRLKLDVPDSATRVVEALRAERLKQCGRVDLGAGLSDRLVCGDCRLALGESTALRPVAELADLARSGVAQFLARLRQPATRELVEHGLADLPDDGRARSVRRLLADGHAAEELLPDTGFAVIDLLNTILVERVVARRSVEDLAYRLRAKRLTRRQVTDSFADWLDPDGRLADDDLIDLDD